MITAEQCNSILNTLMLKFETMKQDLILLTINFNDEQSVNDAILAVISGQLKEIDSSIALVEIRTLNDSSETKINSLINRLNDYLQAFVAPKQQTDSLRDCGDHLLFPRPPVEKPGDDITGYAFQAHADREIGRAHV